MRARSMPTAVQRCLLAAHRPGSAGALRFACSIASAVSTSDDVLASVQGWLDSKDKSGPLRYPVGAPVECRVDTGHWATGKVVKLNHREPNWPVDHVVPYQVLLDTEHARGDQNAVWVPADVDECIRAALRFQVDEVVECCINPELHIWARGTVVAHFYREAKWPKNQFAPYQVRLESFYDEDSGKTLEGSLIWAPQDSDACIRIPKGFVEAAVSEALNAAAASLATAS